MCELISSDICDHSSRCWHFHIVHERVKKGKSIVKIDTFQKEICDDTAEKGLIIWIVDKILIEFSDVFISLEEDFIISPEVVNLVALLSRHNRLEDSRVALRVDSLLVGLDREDEIDLRTGDIVVKIWEVYGLYRVKKDKKREDSLVGSLLVWRQCRTKISCVVFESRDFFWYPKVSDHYLVH